MKPKYFDCHIGDDGQTPSNTPSNKIKGTLSYNLGNIDFSSKIHSNEENEANDSDKDNEYSTTFCSQITIGRPAGQQLNVCSKLICNKCNSTVKLVENHKKADLGDNGSTSTENQQGSIIKECLVADNEFDFYSCKCISLSIKEPTHIKDLNVDWECEGHIKHK